jgi:hypothetical protein
MAGTLAHGATVLVQERQQLRLVVAQRLKVLASEGACGGIDP